MIGTQTLFSAAEFLSLFNDKTYHLYLVFLNVCNSDNIASIIRNYKRKSAKFYKTIGFSGEILPDHAIDFSKAFYEEFCTRRDHLVPDSIRIAKRKFKNSYDEKNVHLKRINLCKR